MVNAVLSCMYASAVVVQLYWVILQAKWWKAIMRHPAIRFLVMTSGDARQPSIICPRCHFRSYNPQDIREGYCGNCHDWTTPRDGYSRTTDHQG